MEFFRYHDSILEQIIVQWKRGNVTLQITSNEGVDNIELEKVKNVEIPKKEPWGKSNLINEIGYTNSILKIEMQSGDLIQIEGIIIDN